MTLRLLQHCGEDGKRSVLVSDHGSTRFLNEVHSIRALAQQAIDTGSSIVDVVSRLGLGGEIDPATELAAGRLLTPIDHPDPAHLIMSGTGLTHLGSAEARDRMHSLAADKQTDSMRIFIEGLEGGKPAEGKTGCQPEWFYKGNGTQLVRPCEGLEIPEFAADGGEEAELSGIYLIASDGTPHRIGFCLANEFSDHVTERHNYLWLAHSKLRQASLGPELLVGSLPDHVEGTSRIWRNGAIVWERTFLSGEANMSHSIANLEWHHFKYAQFCAPGDIHVHFFGTATLSFSDGFQTEQGDEFEIEANPFRLPLRNRLISSNRQPPRVRML